MGSHGKLSPLTLRELDSWFSPEIRNKVLSLRSSGPDEPNERNKTDPKIHTGFGPDQRQRNLKWLNRLAWAMRKEYWKEGKNNPNIPAGYTYLGQLVTHDISIHSTPPPSGDSVEPLVDADPFDGMGLMLGTIYGEGPENTPLPYAALQPGRKQKSRTHFKLGRIRKRKAGVQDFHLNKSNELLDIPRLGCPYGGKETSGFSDTLIADNRNDDNLILSQLTVFFHTLHNRVFDRINTDTTLSNIASNYNSPNKQFNLARKVVCSVYRSIIVKDLLERLLHHSVLSKFDPETFECTDAMLDYSRPYQDVTPDFLLAAFRIGHAMVNSAYAVNSVQKNENNDPRSFGISEFLDRTSGRKNRHVPLEEDWVIEWQNFFDLGLGHVQSSHRFGPSFRSALMGFRGLTPADSHASNLAEIDLYRGLEGTVRKVSTLIDGLPNSLRFGFEMLSPTGEAPDQVAAVMKMWLDKFEKQNNTELFPPGDELQMTLTDPPPLIFFLVEAAITGDRPEDKGTRLGVLGSALVADSIYRVLRKGYPIIEGDADVMKLASRIFPKSAFENIGDLINWVWPQPERTI